MSVCVCVHYNVTRCYLKQTICNRIYIAVQFSIWSVCVVCELAQYIRHNASKHTFVQSMHARRVTPFR